MKRQLLILFIIAGGIRVGWVAARYSGHERESSLAYPDEVAYWQVADSLASGSGLVDEFGFRSTYMPAYPAFLALFANRPHPMLWARVVQALLGALAAPATAVLAARWLGSGVPDGESPTRTAKSNRLAMTPVFAGLAVAMDPFLIFFSGLFLTEALFAVALVAAWAAVLPLAEKSTDSVGKSSLLDTVTAGALLCVCVYLRPSAIILVLAAPIAIIMLRGFEARSLICGGLITGTVLIGLAPWGMRNQRVLGEWRWLTTRGGISLYDGLRQDATGASDLAHTKTLEDVSGLSETQWDSYFRARAVEQARANPLRLIKLGWSKFLRTWSLRPNVDAYRQGFAARISAAWMTAVLALAIVGWWVHRRAWRSWLMLALPVIAFTLLHTVYVGSVRYRVPVMPMVLVWSAAGLVAVTGRWFNAFHSPGQSTGGSGRTPPHR